MDTKTGQIVELKTALSDRFMKAKCMAISLTDEQRAELGVSPHLRTKFQISVGNVYTVLGLTFMRSGIFGATPLFDVEDDVERCSTVPMCLFEIVDGRPSKYWEVRAVKDFALTLWPEDFYSDFFHEKLGEFTPQYVAIFRKVARRLKDEFA